MAFDYRTTGCVLAGVVWVTAWWVFIDGIVYGTENEQIHGMPWYFALPGVFSTVALVMLNCVRLEDIISVAMRGGNADASRAEIARARFLRGWTFLWFAVHFVCIFSAVWIMVANYPHVWTGVAIMLQPILVLGASCLLLYARKTHQFEMEGN